MTKKGDMWINTWIDYDFKVDVSETKRWCISLKNGVLVTLKRNSIDSNNWSSEDHQIDGIRVVERGIEIWDRDKRGWIPCNDKIMRAFLDYLTEEELKKEDVTDEQLPDK